MTAFAFTVAGALIGIALTSGYNFWAARRVEQIRGSVAAQTLDDEIKWLQDELMFASSARRPTGFDASTAVAVWREQREALVLYVKDEEFRMIGSVLRACERWARTTQREGNPELTAIDVDAANEALVELRKARLLLAALAPYLRSEHEVFILISAWRGVRSLLGKKRDWTRPDLSLAGSPTGELRAPLTAEPPSPIGDPAAPPPPRGAPAS